MKDFGDVLLQWSMRKIRFSINSKQEFGVIAQLVLGW